MELREVFMVNDPKLYVEFREHRQTQYQNFVALQGKKPPIHAKGLSYTRFQNDLYLIFSKYSAGYAIENLQKDTTTLLKKLAEDKPLQFNFKNQEEYIDALWISSLAMLMNVEDELFQKLISSINQTNKDAFFDRIIQFRIKEINPIDTLLYPTSYQSLFDLMFSAKTKQESLCVDFLKEWYTEMKTLPWYDLHLKMNAGFFGYWTPELALLINYYNIDDASFANHLFYPRDFTNNKLIRTYFDDQLGKKDREELKEIKKQHQANAVSDDYSPQLNLNTKLKAAKEKIKKGYQKKKGAKTGNVEDETVFLALFGLSEEEIEKNPESFNLAIYKMLAQILNLIQNKIDIPEDVLTEFEKNKNEINELLIEKGLDKKQVLKNVHPEFRSLLESADINKKIKDNNQRLKTFNTKLSSLLNKKDQEPEELMEAFEKIAVDLGFVEAEPEYNSEKMVEKYRKEVREDLMKIRGSNKIIDFTYEDLKKDDDDEK